MKSILKDLIINHLLSVKNFILYYLKIRPKSKYNVGVLNEIHYYKHMNQSKLEHYYNFTQKWGDYHPKDIKQWYDKSCVALSTRGLELYVKNHLFRIPETDLSGNAGKFITTGVGMCVSKKSYMYGLFIWNVELPIGDRLWPAIWLSGSINWPPEIDVLEGYSNSDGRYKNKLNTNAYYADGLQIGAMSHGFLCKEGKELNLKLDKQKDYIKIYYNNYLVRQITDKNVLASINSEPMNIIMNNAVIDRNPERGIALPFIIKSFEYYENNI